MSLIEAIGGGCYVDQMQSIPPPETITVDRVLVACDGSGEVSPALGHPRVYLRIDPELGFVECGYCDRRFVYSGHNQA